MKDSRKILILTVIALFAFPELFYLINSIALSANPGLEKLSLSLRFGAFSFIFGSIYYLVSLLFFFLFASKEKTKADGVMVAGRLFKIDASINNPSNHIAVGTILLFVSVIFIVVGAR